MDTLTKVIWLIDKAKEGFDRPLSLREAAKYLDCSKSFLYKMVSKKQISYSKCNNTRLYFTKKDLDQFALGNRKSVNDKQS